MRAYPIPVPAYTPMDPYLLDEEFDILEIQTYEAPNDIKHSPVLCDDASWDDIND